MAKVEFKISPNHIKNVLCSGEASIKLVKEEIKGVLWANKLKH